MSCHQHDVVKPAELDPHAHGGDPAVHQQHHNGEHRKDQGGQELQQMPVVPEAGQQWNQDNRGKPMQDSHGEIAVQVRRDRGPGICRNQQGAKQ